MSEPTDEQPTASANRVVVVGGGTPSPGELAALTVALTPVGSGDDHAAGDRVPAWARAALVEGVGHRVPTRPSDIVAAVRLG